MAKFLAIDANGLNIVFGGSDINFVTPHCQKEITSSKHHSVPSTWSSDDAGQHQVELQGFCVSQFEPQAFFWEPTSPEKMFVINSHITSDLSFLYLENTLPPPRMA